MSLYSGKVRAYLRYKGIPYIEKPVHLWDFGAIRKNTGAVVMPVVVTPLGEWLQDSSFIMDRLETVFPEAPVLPVTPRQRIAALLLEAWGDEFWLPSAMHYRWNFPENYALFERECGRDLLPFAPRFIQKRLARKPATLMRSFLAGLGVTPLQSPIIEAWTLQQLDALDAHFATQPYLLGTRPSYGDFGLIGPLYAHLGRDPYPKRELIAPRKYLAAWVARMQAPAVPRGGDFLTHDAIPPTLAPIFQSVFAEFWPALAAIQAEVTKVIPAKAGIQTGRNALDSRLRGHDVRLRRSLGEIEYPLAGEGFRRLATPFSLWMAQRPLDAYAALVAAEKAEVDDWLATVGGEQAMQLKIAPRLTRRALHVALE